MSNELDTVLLVEESARRLFNNLKRYGNEPSVKQQEALRAVLKMYAEIGTGEVTGRFAFPLQTGTGKTQSIIAFLAALNDLGHEDIGVVICASKVEALCELKRNLEREDVLSEKIGLVHSYRFDPEKARGFLDGIAELPIGFASEPVTDGNNDRQFLLLTHQRVKSNLGIAKFNFYRGNPRQLVIWDESLLASDAFAFEDDLIRASWAYLREMNRSTSPERDEALAYLGDAIERIKKEMSLQQNDPNRKERIFRLAPITEDQIEIYKQSLGSGEQANLLKDLLDIAQEELRVLCNVEQGGGVITFRVSVPRELENIVILDASYPIRELARLDTSIKQAAIPENIVSYENVTVHQLDHASSRTAMEKAYLAKRGYNKITREVAEVIKYIPQSEGIILFTYKGRGRLDYRKIIERDLRAEGIDMDAKIKVNGEFKPRFTILTWGNETSLSQYSYCSNVFLVGIIHRSHIDIGGEIVGQSGDLLRSVTNSEIRDVVQSEISHAAYQAISRGSCRIMQGNKTKSMKVWLLHPEREHLEGRIRKVMPGIKWVKWEPRFIETEKANTKAGVLAQRIRTYLDRLHAEGVQKVSLINLKKALQLTDAPKNTVGRGVKKAVESTEGVWILRGKTVWQVPAFLFG